VNVEAHQRDRHLNGGLIFQYLDHKQASGHKCPSEKEKTWAKEKCTGTNRIKLKIVG
jgi:hypothetical protein